MGLAPEELITLVAAFHEAEAAERDAARLNKLNGQKKCRHLVMLTRLKD
jgi:hypothetical protein